MNRRTDFPLPQHGASPATVLIAIATATVVLLVAIHSIAVLRRNGVRRAWQATLGSLEDVIERYPKREANAIALDIERRSANLGIDVVPRFVEDEARPGPDPGRVEAFHRVKSTVYGSFLKPLLEHPNLGDVGAPPEELLSYLLRNAGELGALRGQLNNDSAPLWESNISKLSSAPISNLLGQLDLHKLMLSAALARIHAGDEATALEYLDASWQLAGSLRDSPILINQLVLIAVTRTQMGVLRHVGDAPETWRDRLNFDHRAAFLQSMKYEAWHWLYVENLEDNASIWQKALGPVVGPIMTYSVSDVSDSFRNRIENLETVEAICDYDLTAQEADLNVGGPKWNPISQIAIPNLASAVDRLASLELDLEMTRLTLEAKWARRSNASGWQDELVGERASTTCPNDTWQTSVAGEGIRIGFSREIAWPISGPILPTHAIIDGT